MTHHAFDFNRLVTHPARLHRVDLDELAGLVGRLWASRLEAHGPAGEVVDRYVDEMMQLGVHSLSPDQPALALPEGVDSRSDLGDILQSRVRTDT